jgi:pimeloyl-ACP methyl ester carboxylesterase
MNEITQSERIASPSQSGLDSPARRSLMKAMAGLGATLASSSLSPAIAAQTQSHQPGSPANQVPPVQDLWGPFTPSSGAGRYLQLSYPPSTTKGELQLGAVYTLWIPDDIKTVRAVIVHQHGASIPAAQAGATSAYDLHWQALAKKWSCVLLGPSYRVLNDAIDLTPGGAELWFDPRQGSERVFLRALDEFATKSGHAEIATVPWCLWGHSGGGIWANVMSILHPDRVLAAFLRSGTAVMFRSRPEFIQPEVPPAIYEIPTMVNFGVGERGNRPWDGSIATFQEYRAQGAPIGLAPDPRTGHFCGDSRYFAIPFFDACLQMRLTEWSKILRPVDLSSAWLATPFGDTAVPAAEFKGDPNKAAWLPNEATAKIWMEYVRTGTVSDAGAPPAPVNVRVHNVQSKPDANHGNEITWEAEADIVSGLGGFIVLRDGHGIAKLPTQPPEVVYGRLLFQGLSYHDTPVAPIPQMRHVDMSAQPGAKHVYTVIALSSAGVPSMPSLPATVE